MTLSSVPDFEHFSKGLHYNVQHYSVFTQDMEEAILIYMGGNKETVSAPNLTLWQLLAPCKSTLTTSPKNVRTMWRKLGTTHEPKSYSGPYEEAEKKMFNELVSLFIFFTSMPLTSSVCVLSSTLSLPMLR